MADETLAPLSRAARMWLPESLRGGRPVSPKTLARWGSRGLRGVRLRITRVGGTWCTSASAIEEFLAALTALADAEQGDQKRPGRMQKEVDRKLDQMGI